MSSVVEGGVVVVTPDGLAQATALGQVQADELQQDTLALLGVVDGRVDDLHKLAEAGAGG